MSDARLGQGQETIWPRQLSRLVFPSFLSSPRPSPLCIAANAHAEPDATQLFCAPTMLIHTTPSDCYDPWLT